MILVTSAAPGPSGVALAVEAVLKMALSVNTENYEIAATEMVLLRFEWHRCILESLSLTHSRRLS
jgi:hypothetical protein